MLSNPKISSLSIFKPELNNYRNDRNTEEDFIDAPVSASLKFSETTNHCTTVS